MTPPYPSDLHFLFAGHIRISALSPPSKHASSSLRRPGLSSGLSAETTAQKPTCTIQKRLRGAHSVCPLTGELPDFRAISLGF